MHAVGRLGEAGLSFQHIVTKLGCSLVDADAGVGWYGAPIHPGSVVVEWLKLLAPRAEDGRLWMLHHRE